MEQPGSFVALDFKSLFPEELMTTKYLRGDPLCFQAPISLHTISFTFLKLEFDTKKVSIRYINRLGFTQILLLV